MWKGSLDRSVGTCQIYIVPLSLSLFISLSLSIYLFDDVVGAALFRWYGELSELIYYRRLRNISHHPLRGIALRMVGRRGVGGWIFIWASRLGRPGAVFCDIKPVPRSKAKRIALILYARTTQLSHASREYLRHFVFVIVRVRSKISKYDFFRLLT